MQIELPTPRWSLPLLEPARYKGAYGGRSGGKSHFFAEMLVIEKMLPDPDLRWVCIREIQKTLRHSAKTLIERKIRQNKLEGLFDIRREEIRRRDGEGVVIFQGMQDHTADSIKSLEGFNGAWVEEGQTLKNRSFELLLPTIREPGSEIWATWNPEDPSDPVDKFFRHDAPSNAICVPVNYTDNPFLSKEIKDEAELARRRNPDTFDHIWLGGYNRIDDAQIFKDKWRVDSFEVGRYWEGPYQGLDFGFSGDPMAAIRVWINDDRLFIEHDPGETKIELDDVPGYFSSRIPGFANYPIAADDSRPDTISYLQRHGLPTIYGAEKGKGSIEDGIAYIRSFKEIVIHPRCKNIEHEARHYRYKVDRATGKVTRIIEDKHNHWWDACRYALRPLMKDGAIDYGKLL